MTVSKYQKILDFANLVKAFTGTNYLAMPFAFQQAGIILGSLMLIFIAVITDYCCVSIVRSKRKIIEEIMTCLADDKSFDEHSSNSNNMLSEIKRRLELNMNLGDIAKYCLGRFGLWVVNFCLFITQFGFGVNYFIFIGNSLFELFPLFNVTVPEKSSMETLLIYIDSSSNSSETPLSSTLSPVVWHNESSAPSLLLLVASPVLIFIGFSFIRNIRIMGSVSVVANVSIFGGGFVIIGYMLKDFYVGKSIKFAKSTTFPVFFGLCFSAYEGIGTIIPIEASMVGNRKNFDNYLHGALLWVSMILGSFGVIGYLKYSDETAQILIQNLPQHTTLAFVVDITLIVGVIFTYPLQVFPCVEMIEQLLFQHGRILGPSGQSSRRLLDEKDDDRIVNVETAAQLHDIADIEDKFKLPKSRPISHEVPTWLRNGVRMLLVLVQMGVAVAMREKYAYFSAFMGAIGSSFLAYMLPVMVNLRLNWTRMSRVGVVRDVFIFVFGVVGSILGLIVTIQSIFQSKTQSH